MTLLVVLLAWALLALASVAGLSLLFAGRRVWEYRARADGAAATAPDAVRRLPLAS